METLTSSRTVALPARGLTPEEISRVLVRAYPEARGLDGLMIRWRPYICPFHELMKAVPERASFVDIGCGVGMMGVLLAYLRGATRVIGVDTSMRAIETARRAVLPPGTVGSFHCVSTADPWPGEAVTDVTCLDVLHHVPANEQRHFIGRLARLNFTGTIHFKDVSPKPGWKALGSHAHDLIVARERIFIRDEDEVRRWFEDEGLVVSEPRRLDMLWYTHYALTASRKSCVSS